MVSSTEATAEEPDKNVCRDVTAERVRRLNAASTGKYANLKAEFAYLRSPEIDFDALNTNLEASEAWSASEARRRLVACRMPPMTMRLEEVPEGAFLVAPSLSEMPALLWKGFLYPWMEGQYGAPIKAGCAACETKVIIRPGFRFLQCGFHFDPDLAPDV